MNFPDLITKFSEKNEISMLSCDDDSQWQGSGPARAILDDAGTILEVHPVSKKICRLMAEITTVDPSSEDGMRTLVTLLKANLALMKESLGSLTICDSNRKVLLFQNVDLETNDANSFTEIVEGFLDTLDVFRNGLSASQ